MSELCKRSQANLNCYKEESNPEIFSGDAGNGQLLSVAISFCSCKDAEDCNLRTYNNPTVKQSRSNFSLFIPTKCVDFCKVDSSKGNFYLCSMDVKRIKFGKLLFKKVDLKANRIREEDIDLKELCEYNPLEEYVEKRREMVYNYESYYDHNERKESHKDQHYIILQSLEFLRNLHALEKKYTRLKREREYEPYLRCSHKFGDKFRQKLDTEIEAKYFSTKQQGKDLPTEDKKTDQQTVDIKKLDREEPEKEAKRQQRNEKPVPSPSSKPLEGVERTTDTSKQHSGGEPIKSLKIAPETTKILKSTPEEKKVQPIMQTKGPQVRGTTAATDSTKRGQISRTPAKATKQTKGNSNKVVRTETIATTALVQREQGATQGMKRQSIVEGQKQTLPHAGTVKQSDHEGALKGTQLVHASNITKRTQPLSYADIAKQATFSRTVTGNQEKSQGGVVVQRTITITRVHTQDGQVHEYVETTDHDVQGKALDAKHVIQKISTTTKEGQENRTSRDYDVSDGDRISKPLIEDRRLIQKTTAITTGQMQDNRMQEFAKSTPLAEGKISPKERISRQLPYGEGKFEKMRTGDERGRQVIKRTTTTTRSQTQDGRTRELSKTASFDSGKIVVRERKEDRQHRRSSEEALEGRHFIQRTTTISREQLQERREGRPYKKGDDEDLQGKRVVRKATTTSREYTQEGKTQGNERITPFGEEYRKGDVVSDDEKMLKGRRIVHRSATMTREQTREPHEKRVAKRASFDEGALRPKVTLTADRVHEGKLIKITEGDEEVLKDKRVIQRTTTFTKAYSQEGRIMSFDEEKVHSQKSAKTDRQKDGSRALKGDEEKLESRRVVRKTTTITRGQTVEGRKVKHVKRSSFDEGKLLRKAASPAHERIHEGKLAKVSASHEGIGKGKHLTQKTTITRGHTLEGKENAITKIRSLDEEAVLRKKGDLDDLKVGEHKSIKTITDGQKLQEEKRLMEKTTAMSRGQIQEDPIHRFSRTKSLDEKTVRHKEPHKIHDDRKTTVGGEGIFKSKRTIHKTTTITKGQSQEYGAIASQNKSVSTDQHRDRVGVKQKAHTVHTATTEKSGKFTYADAAKKAVLATKVGDDDDIHRSRGDVRAISANVEGDLDGVHKRKLPHSRSKSHESKHGSTTIDNKGVHRIGKAARNNSKPYEGRYARTIIGDEEEILDGTDLPSTSAKAHLKQTHDGGHSTVTHTKDHSAAQKRKIFQANKSTTGEKRRKSEAPDDTYAITIIGDEESAIDLPF